MRVLLIEPDAATAETIELMLKHSNFNVSATGLGDEGIELAKLYDYDVIISEIGLLDITGHEMLRALRDARIATPVLILSGMAGIEDKVRALDQGADDYLTKPFHKDELIARINAVVRRTRGHAQPVITVGDLVVNINERTVDIGGSRVVLPGREYDVLEALALRKGGLMTKEMIFNRLYGGRDEPEIKIVDVLICKIRRKIEAAADGRNYIETVWGRGYKLTEPAFCPPPSTKPAGVTRAMIAEQKAAAHRALAAL